MLTSKSRSEDRLSPRLDGHSHLPKKRSDSSEGTQVVDPDAGTWNFTYNALGELPRMGTQEWARG